MAGYKGNRISNNNTQLPVLGAPPAHGSTELTTSGRLPFPSFVSRTTNGRRPVSARPESCSANRPSPRPRLCLDLPSPSGRGPGVRESHYPFHRSLAPQRAMTTCEFLPVVPAQAGIQPCPRLPRAKPRACPSGFPRFRVSQERPMRFHIFTNSCAGTTNTLPFLHRL